MRGTGAADGVFLTISAHMRPETFLIAAGCGAGLAGAATHRLFGRRGWQGWVLALAGALLATGLGATLAGLATLRGDQFGLVVTAVVMTLLTPMGVLWLALMAGVHLLAGRARG
ncbi:MAG: hypothetical protein R3D85_07810 [Paracoccaceae bacterium]